VPFQPHACDITPEYLQTTLTFRREGEAIEQIFVVQLREVREDLMLGHDGREVSVHLTDRDSRTTHTGLSEPNFEVDGNSTGRSMDE